MGRGLSPSLSAGPLHSLLPRLKSTSLRADSLHAILLPLTAVLIMVLGFSPVTVALRLSGSSENQRQTCNTKQCWDLFVSSQDYYQVQMEYEYVAHPQLEHEKWQGLCISQRTFYHCLQAMYRNKSLDCHSNIGFRSAYNGIERRMQEMNCSLDGITFDPSKMPRDQRQVCTYDGAPVLRYCALFGDPHLRTFSDQLETCQIQGAWPLLDNRYLTVQVTSKAVDNLAGPATAITQLTVMVKRHDDCAVERFVTYQAQAGLLPSVFDDGSVHFGPEKSVQLREVVADRHIEIYLRYIDTRIIVRHYPYVETSFLTVGIVIPEMILNQSMMYTEDDSVHMLELCSQGCPRSQQINYAEYLARGGTTTRQRQIGSSTQRLFTEEKNSIDGMMVMMRREAAVEKCRRLKLVDFYLDSCVFDLMNTGDENFSLAALDAMNDAIRHHPNHTDILQNRTTLLLDHNSSYNKPSSAQNIHSPGDRTRTSLIILTAIISCALSRCLCLPMLLLGGGQLTSHR